MSKVCDSLDYDSDIIIEVDDKTFIPTEADKARVYNYLPLTSDIVTESDQ